MLLLAIACALISALMIAVISLWQRHVAADSGGLPFEKALYARFIADIERREARGDIDADLAREERVEAARALLKAGETQAQTPPVNPRFVMIAISAVVALSFGGYFLLGTPQLPDQPYQQRLKQWAATAETDPGQLPPEAVAAVLRHKAPAHMNDAAFWLVMARVDVAAENYYNAEKDFDRAHDLSPATFAEWSELGEAQTLLARGTDSPAARASFEKALSLDPKDPSANFYLGKMNLNAGHYDEAKAQFQIVLSQLAPDDTRRRALVADEIAQVATAQTADAAMHARIGGMVAALESQLKEDPENPPGWSRLLRSYNVLGDSAGEARTLAEVKAHYAARPDVAASIINNAQNAVGSENTGGEP